MSVSSGGPANRQARCAQINSHLRCRLTVANIATALTVLSALVFGLIETRRARKDGNQRLTQLRDKRGTLPQTVQNMRLA